MSNHRVLTWNTHKIDGGFEYHVYSFAHQEPNETLQRGVCATRAQAAGLARRWLRWYKSRVVRNAAA